jgi:hypothetical protein
MLRAIVVLSSLLVSAWAGPVAAENGKLSGYMFGDYNYYVAAAVDSVEGRNAIQFRRIYLTYDQQVDDGLSARFRLEANDAGFGKGAKMVPFVKHAYLKWSKYLSGADLYVGLSGTPTWALAEGVWGYRSIEKTVLDRNKIGSSADLGFALKGKAGAFNYFTMIGNGPGQKSEDDNGKKIYASLSWAATESLVLEGYADYNVRSEDRSERTVKFFAGLRGDGFNGGAEVFSRTNAADGGADETISGVSLFGSQPLVDQLKGFARVDAVRNDVEDSTNMLVIVGLDHSPRNNMHWMPNLYVEKPDGGDPDVQGRLTFFFKF